MDRFLITKSKGSLFFQTHLELSVLRTIEVAITVAAAAVMVVVEVVVAVVFVVVVVVEVEDSPVSFNFCHDLTLGIHTSKM